MKVENISTQLARSLVHTQFPQYRDLLVESVNCPGHDNRTFRLGEEMLIRLPSAQGYEAQVKKEHTWLPVLAQHISFPIPTPRHMGKPSEQYPWHWSIYDWLPGESANQIMLTDSLLEDIAKDLTTFLKELHQAPTQGAPEGGQHNFFRGCHPSIYDEDARTDIDALTDVIDAPKALAIWEEALSSNWENDPVWVHGDMASGNLLINQDRLSAIIDFGCIGIGDPACDLVIAWTLFHGASREVFQNGLALDANTWARARGWALWKANFLLKQQISQKSSVDNLLLSIIHDILNA